MELVFNYNLLAWNTFIIWKWNFKLQYPSFPKEKSRTLMGTSFNLPSCTKSMLVYLKHKQINICLFYCLLMNIVSTIFLLCVPTTLFLLLSSDISGSPHLFFLTLEYGCMIFFTPKNWYHGHKEPIQHFGFSVIWFLIYINDLKFISSLSWDWNLVLTRWFLEIFTWKFLWLLKGIWNWTYHCHLKSFFKQILSWLSKIYCSPRSPVWFHALSSTLSFYESIFITQMIIAMSLLITASCF